MPDIKNNTIKEESLSALEVLGYSRIQSEKVIDNIIQSSPDSSIEELIKEALNKLDLDIEGLDMYEDLL